MEGTPSIEISAGISKPARRRRRTRHKRSPMAVLQPVPVEDPNDGDDDSSEAVDDEDPPPPTITVRPLPLLQQKVVEPSDSVIPVRAVGFPEGKVRWTGLQAKDRVMHRMSAMVPSKALPRRPSGRRWRAHASDYDEQLAMIHIFKPPLPPTHAEKRHVSAYCTCGQIALFKLLKWLDKYGREVRRAEVGNYGSVPATTSTPAASPNFALSGWKSEMFLEVLHSSLIPGVAESTAATNEEEATTRHRAAALLQKHSFFFSSGCCIFWGLTREEEARQLMMLSPFSSGRMDQVDTADMEFSYGDESCIAKDAITLSSTTVAEKMALSFAMAQSATLGVFETRVEDRIRSTKHIPSSLATVGSIQYSQDDTSKLIGQLFIELADVNIHSNILDEPEYFLKSTDNDDFKNLYEKMLKYQEVANRVSILNKRLSILRDLVGVLNQQLTQHQGAKLEWIIIWILVFQVVIALGWEIMLKDILGYFRWG